MVLRLGQQATREPRRCGRRNSTAARKLRRAAGAARGRRQKPAVTILFSYDGSESADAAIAAAGKLLDHDRADAVVLTVWEPLVVEALRANRFGGWPPIPPDVTQVDQHAQKQAQLLAEHGARRSPAASCRSSAPAAATRSWR